MHAKPGHPALPTFSETAVAAPTPVGAVLPAAFSKALGNQPNAPHPVAELDVKGTKSAVKAKTIEARGLDRAAPVKPIMPRSGHR